MCISTLKWLRRAVMLAAAAAGVGGVSAQLPESVTSSPEQAAAAALPGDQSWPQVAVSDAGGWLVWQDNAVTPLALRIRAQRLSLTGVPAGAELTVSSLAKKKTTGDQEKPVVVALNDGGALVLWQGVSAWRQQIWARALDASGAFVSKKDLRVSTAKSTKKKPVNEMNPAAAKLADGSVVAVWSATGLDGSMQGVFGQLLSPTGSKLGRGFQINQTTLLNQRNPAVAALANGNFVVAWVSELQRGDSSVDIYARIFNPSGVALTGELLMNVSNTNSCANPSLATLAGGGFAAAWSQQDAVTRALASNPSDPTDARPGTPGLAQFTGTAFSTNGWDVFGVICDVNGAKLGTPVRLNTHTLGEQFAPKLAVSGNRVLAVWTSLGQDGSREGVFGQFLNGDGAPLGGEFRLNGTTISRQMQPDLTATGGGRFLAVWSSFGAGTGFNLFARSYQETAGQ